MERCKITDNQAVSQLDPYKSFFFLFAGASLPHRVREPTLPARFARPVSQLRRQVRPDPDVPVAGPERGQRRALRPEGSRHHVARSHLPQAFA